MPFSEADPVPSGTGHGKAERAIWLVKDTKTSGIWVSPCVSLLGLARLSGRISPARVSFHSPVSDERETEKFARNGTWLPLREELVNQEHRLT